MSMLQRAKFGFSAFSEKSLCTKTNTKFANFFTRTIKFQTVFFMASDKGEQKNDEKVFALICKISSHTVIKIIVKMMDNQKQNPVTSKRLDGELILCELNC